MKIVSAPHPASLTNETLLKQCEIAFGRGSGPGGQHRNKVETYVTITHSPTGITASAGERRSQIQNRGQATRRVRLALAREVRTKVDRNNHRRSELWEQRRQGKQLSVNPTHTDYPALLAEALDVIYARKFDVAGSAGVLGVSMSQLAKLVRHDKRAFGVVNQGREERGMPRLK